MASRFHHQRLRRSYSTLASCSVLNLSPLIALNIWSFPHSIPLRQTLISSLSRRPLKFNRSIMVSWSSDSSASSRCPEEHRGATSRLGPPDETLSDLDNSFMDDPPQCPHVAHMREIARRQRDKVYRLEEDVAHERHLASNVENVNEQLFERVSGLSAYNCTVVNDLAAARSLAAKNGKAAMKYFAGFWIMTSLFFIAAVYILFSPRK